MKDELGEGDFELGLKVEDYSNWWIEREGEKRNQE